MVVEIVSVDDTQRLAGIGHGGTCVGAALREWCGNDGVSGRHGHSLRGEHSCLGVELGIHHL